MSSPVVAQAPYPFLEAVEDTNLAVNRSGCAAVSVAVESDCLDKVLVTVLENGLKAGAIVNQGGIGKKCGCFRHGGRRLWRGEVKNTVQIQIQDRRLRFIGTLDGGAKVTSRRWLSIRSRYQP